MAMQGRQIPPLVECANCHTDINVDENEIPAAYFRGVLQSCPECSLPFDWWEVMLTAIRHPMPFGQQLAPVGARMTMINVLLRPNQRLTVRFSDHGVPDDAKIFLVHYTPQSGGLFPIEMHGNTPRRRGVPSEVQLFPVPMGDGSNGETQVNILVTWAPIDQLNYAWLSLVDAFEAYHAGLYHEAVVPANVEVESKLNALLSQFFNRNATADSVRGFLINGATYGRQLSVLLPALVGLIDAPALPDEIRGKLSQLNRLRNEIVHTGRLASTPNRDEMAELLCSALFGYRYLKIIEPLLLK
jgi:hypothetical protein